MNKNPQPHSTMQSAYARSQTLLAVGKGILGISSVALLALSLYYGLGALFVFLAASMPVWGAYTLCALAGFLILGIWARMSAMVQALFKG